MKLSEKIKCLFEQVNNLLTFKPQLDYNSETNTLTSVYINGKSASTLIETDPAPIEGTWAELEQLRSTSKLVPGASYILTDYQTKYLINGSDSEDTNTSLFVTGNISGYTTFSPSCVDTEVIGQNGDTAIVEELPAGYTGSLSVGETVTVDAYFNCGYIRFTPRVLDAGIVLKVSKVRYPALGSGVVILDSNNKPILKPGGVINTDVHDGTPYADMTAQENPIVPTERISLKAIDEQTFSLEAESLTFVGDTLLYDFNDSVILDEAGNQVSTRNGYILKRVNTDRSINVNKDWRVQRYRRYKIPQTDLEKFLHEKTQQDTVGGLYAENGILQFTVANPINESKKYLLSSPKEIEFYIDFTKINEDPFLSGGPGENKILRVQENSGRNVLVDIETDLSTVVNAKDLFIFPIVNNEPDPLKVSFFQVGNLKNTVVENYGNYVNSVNLIDVKSENRLFLNSTCYGSLTIDNKGDIDSVISLDYINIVNTGIIIKMTNFNYVIDFINKGSLYNVLIGSVPRADSTSLAQSNSITFGAEANIRNSMIGGKRKDYTEISAVASHLFYREEWGFQSILKGLMYLTKLNSTNTNYNDSQATEIELNTFNDLPSKGGPGYVYEYNILPSNTKLNNYNDNRDLVYTRILSNGNTELVTFSTPL